MSLQKTIKKKQTPKFRKNNTLDLKLVYSANEIPPPLCNETYK